MTKHPILEGSGFKLYSLIWAVVIALHGSVLHFYYEFPIEIAVADSLFFNLTFAALATGFWYLVAFANLNKDDTSLITTHVGAAFISISVWITLAGFILKFIFRENEAYHTFLEETFMWRAFIGVMYYSIVVLIFYLIKYYQDMQTRLNRELELQNLLKDSELRMLKSQINPHFIFNSLNSINALTMTKPESAREMVVKLSEFLRYSLGKESIEMNTLEQEIKNVSLYLDIEKVRFGEKLIFEKEVSSDCLKVKVPNLILQPLFENAIKYGVYDSTEPITIRLNCKPNEDSLELSIVNNFYKDSFTKKGEGIGLDNVRKRLSLVFGRTDLLKIKKEQNQFQVVMTIPINSATDE